MRNNLLLSSIAIILAAVALIISFWNFRASRARIDGLRQEQNDLAGEVNRLRPRLADREGLAGGSPTAPTPQEAEFTSSTPKGTKARTERDPGGEQEEDDRAISARSPELLEAILERLPAGDVDHRRQAIEDLMIYARWGNEKAIAQLVSSLEDEDARVRRDAVKAIGELGDPELVEHLGVAAQDSEWRVRREVARTLRRIPEGAEPYLTGFLADPDQRVVASSLKSIRKGGYDGAGPEVARLLDDDDAHLVAAAGETLRVLGHDHDADQAVVRLAKDLQDPDPGKRRLALRRIARIGGPVALPYLRRALTDGDAEVRREAEAALEKLES